MASNNIHAQKQVEEITQMYANLTKEINKAVAITKEYQKTNQKLPSEYLSSLEQLRKVQDAYTKAVAEANGRQKEYTAQKKEEARQEQQNIKLKTQLAQSNTKLAKENARLNEQRKLNNKQLREEAKILVKSQGMYNLIQQRVNKLTKQYNDLAAKKALNNKLSFKEEMSLQQSQKALTKYQNILKKVDADIGKHQRNVGNYRSAFDGLGFSVAQITREAPAFANSMQTGFMAISNNIPMLVDEINKLKVANKELIAQGKPAKSVFKSLAKAIFSFQSLVSLGIVLLTVYGKEMVEWVSGLIKGEKALTDLSDAQEEINTQMGESVGKFVALVRAVQDSTRSEKDRKAAMDEIKDLYPDFNAEILNEKDNIVLVNTAIDNYITKLGKKAKAQAALKLVQEKYTELLTKEQETNAILDNSAGRTLTTLKEREEQISKNSAELDKWNKFSEKSVGLEGELAESSKIQNLAATQYNKSKEEEAEIQNEINGLLEVYVDNVDFSGKAKKKNIKETEKEISLLKDYVEQIKGVVKGAEKFDELIGKPAIAKLSELTEEELDEMNTMLENKLYDVNKDVSIGLSPDEFALLREQFNELGRLYGIDAEKFTALFDDKENTVEDYIAAAGEAVKGLYGLFANNYNDDLERLQESYEFQSRFAEEGTAAREELDRQYDKKRKELARKQAEQEKQQAIFSTIINTASAIVEALPNVPLSVAIGVIGAAQIAAIASQPLPQFKDGVRNFEGGLAIVGDGGKKEVITTDKGVFTTPATDTLVNLPKGANVYSSQTEFDKELDKMLNFNGILNEKQYFPIIKSVDSFTSSEFNKGITRLERTIKQGQGNGSLHFDERGFTKYLNKNKITKNNILRLKGRTI